MNELPAPFTQHECAIDRTNKRLIGLIINRELLFLITENTTHGITHQSSRIGGACHIWRSTIEGMQTVTGWDIDPEQVTGKGDTIALRAIKVNSAQGASSCKLYAYGEGVNSKMVLAFGIPTAIFAANGFN